MKAKLILLITAVALSATLFAVASSATGALFNDSKTGNIGGDIGTIKISTGGGVVGSPNELSFVWNNMLPGVPRTATVTYKNTGNNPADIYLTFPNATALSALNNLGTYGSVSITSTGGQRWASLNVKDNWPQGSDGGTRPRLWAVPGIMPLHTSLMPGETQSMTFTFAYDARLNNDSQGQPFNVFPVADQTFVNPGEVGNGLPFSIVAEQVGQLPSMPVYNGSQAKYNGTLLPGVGELPYVQQF